MTQADLGNQAGSLGDGNELGRRHQPTGGMLPAHQRLDTDQTATRQVVYRLVMNAQLLLLQGATKLKSNLDPLLRVGGEFFSVQGVAIASGALGLEQRRVGIAQ